jgi:MFS family permease
MVFIVFACFMWFAVVIPAALFLRHRPESIGLVPDGEREVTPTAPTKPATARGRFISNRDFTINEALRTPAFWGLLAVSIISSTGTGAVHLHLASYLTDVGISSDASAAVVSVTALVGGFGSIFWGTLAERISVHWGLVAIYMGAAISMLILASHTSVTAAFLFAVIFGLASRGGGVLVTVATADFYGRANLGAIQGMIVPIQVAGLGIGQVFAPLMQSATGSYRAAFLILAALYCISAVIGATVRPPRDATPIAAASAIS